MRFRLRTLLIVLAVGPPLLIAAWWFLVEPFVVTPAIYIRSQLRHSQGANEPVLKRYHLTKTD